MAIKELSKEDSLDRAVRKFEEEKRNFSGLDRRGEGKNLTIPKEGIKHNSTGFPLRKDNKILYPRYLSGKDYGVATANVPGRSRLIKLFQTVLTPIKAIIERQMAAFSQKYEGKQIKVLAIPSLCITNADYVRILSLWEGCLTIHLSQLNSERLSRHQTHTWVTQWLS